VGGDNLPLPPIVKEKHMSITKIKSAASGEPAIGLERNARKHVAVSLAQMLAETYLTQLRTQYYHWNVRGEHFNQLHTLFEGQYNALAAGVDELAERLRALGYPAPGTFSEFLSLAKLEEDTSLPADWQTMVSNLLMSNEALARHLREGIKEAQEAGDEGSADLFIRRLQEHEKAAWMLRSYLQ
jgi:starvation-inducible DNA-binding protein